MEGEREKENNLGLINDNEKGNCCIVLYAYIISVHNREKK